MASNSESPKYNQIESKKLGYGFTFVLIGLLALVTGIIILSIEVITGAIVGIIIGFIIMSTSKITIPPNNTLEKQPIYAGKQIDDGKALLSVYSKSIT